MFSHFLLSAKARTLSLVSVLRLSDRDAETMFASLRWMDGKAECPHCGCPTCYEARRPNGALRFRCKACRKDFSLTSGTLFALHKLPLQTYLAAIVIFCNEVKGKSALALSRDLDVQYKTAWVMSHKIRKAVASEMKGFRLSGEGKTVEVDGGYFGGYIKPANHKKNRRDRRLLRNQNGKRQCVVVMRERDGQTMASAFPTETAAASFIRSHVAQGTEIMADEANSWNALQGRYLVKRINHQLAYSADGACTNGPVLPNRPARSHARRDARESASHTRLRLACGGAAQAEHVDLAVGAPGGRSERRRGREPLERRMHHA